METGNKKRWTPWIGERIPIAWMKAVAILGDGEFHDFAELLPAMAEAGKIEMKTAGNILREGVTAGVFERTGEYNTNTKKGRMIRFIQPVDSKWVFQPDKKQTPKARMRELERRKKKRFLTPNESFELQRLADKLYVESDPIEKKWDQRD